MRHARSRAEPYSIMLGRASKRFLVHHPGPALTTREPVICFLLGEDTVMNPLNKSLKAKLIAIILATSTIVLIFTAASFVMYEWVTVREQLNQYVRAIGEIVAANSTARVASANALETLATLRADPYIVEAALYDGTGRLFASYSTNEVVAHIPPRPKADGLYYDRQGLTYVAPVVQSGNRVGTLYLRRVLTPVYHRFGLYAGIVLLVMATSFALAYIVSNLLQQRITKPILSLVTAAKAVSERKDFSVRAQKFSQDELGVLTDAFNEMLG